MLTTLLLLIPLARADCAPPDLAAATLEARRLLDDAEAAAALARVQSAEQNLGCLDQLATKDALAALFRVGGAAALSAGQNDEASRLFATSARMAGEVVFDPTLGAAAAQMYTVQMEFARTAQTGSVLAHVPARLDGWDLSVEEARAVVPGTHLVQRLGADGAVRSSVEAVAGGATLEVGVAAATASDPPSRRSIGRVIAASMLVAGGGACLYGAGVSGQYARDLRTRDAARPVPWPEEEAAEAPYRTGAAVLAGGGLVGIGLGVTLFGTTVSLSSQTLSFTHPL